MRPNAFRFKSAYYQEVIGQLISKLGGSNLVQGHLQQMMLFEDNLHRVGCFVDVDKQI